MEREMLNALLAARSFVDEAAGGHNVASLMGDGYGPGDSQAAAERALAKVDRAIRMLEKALAAAPVVAR